MPSPPAIAAILSRCPSVAWANAAGLPTLRICPVAARREGLPSGDLAPARARVQMREHLLDVHDVGVFVMQIEQIDFVADE
jgi:hypothetical protein